MSNEPRPMAWEPLAQAALTVILMPRSLNRQPKFIVTVEFIDWKMAPDPTMRVFFFSRIVSTLFTTASALLSLP